MDICTFNDFKDYIKNNEEFFLKLSGNCASCSRKKICHSDNKKKEIGSILDTTCDNTRFPIALKIVQKANWILRLIPSFVYEREYGFYGTSNLPCPFMASEIVKNIDKIQEVYNMLSDDESRETYIKILMYRVTMDRQYLSDSFCKDPQYFIEEYSNLGKDEVVVDCGGYTGDTLTDYLKYNQPPEKYYIYEPGEEQVEIIKDLINNCNVNTQFVVSQNGLYKKTATLWFVDGKGSSSYMSEEPVENAVEVKVVGIDEDIEDDISFIKMDIEGFEKFAIEGCKNHIGKTYPKLAICIYHYINDMWEIPLMIKNMFSEYNCFEIRHHQKNSFSETVLYAYKSK